MHQFKKIGAFFLLCLFAMAAVSAAFNPRDNVIGQSVFHITGFTYVNATTDVCVVGGNCISNVTDGYLLDTGDSASGDYDFGSGALFIDDSANNVSIGTTTSIQKLTVHGGGIQIRSLGGSDDEVILGIDEGTSNPDEFQLIGNMGGSGASNQIVWRSFQGVSLLSMFADAVSGGLLGINTEDPNATLDVVGDIKASGGFTGDLTGAVTGNADTATALAANGANCAAGQYPLGVDESGAVESCTSVGSGSGNVTGTGGTDNYVAVWTNSTHVEGDSNLYWNGSSLSIGDTGPDATLDVHDMGNAAVAIFDTAEGSSPFYFSRAGSTTETLRIYVDDNVAYLRSVQDESSNGRFEFEAEEGDAATIAFNIEVDSDDTDVEAFTIMGDGKVGIGNQAPDTELHVAGDVKASGEFLGFLNMSYLTDGPSECPNQNTFMTKFSGPNSTCVALNESNITISNLAGSLPSTSLSDGGTIGFDWVDAEVADDLTIDSSSNVTTSASVVVGGVVKIDTGCIYHNGSHMVTEATCTQ